MSFDASSFNHDNPIKIRLTDAQIDDLHKACERFGMKPAVMARVFFEQGMNLLADADPRSLLGALHQYLRAA